MYPRPSVSLLPEALRPTVGAEVVPSRLCHEHGLQPGTRLDALDETVWQRLPASSVRALAAEVVRVVRRRWPDVRAISDPVSATSVALSDVDGGLSPRARNRLRVAGWQSWIQFRSVTVADLAAIPHLGAQLLLEILTAVEATDRGQPSGTVDSSGSPSTIPDPSPGERPSRAIGRLAKGIARARWSGRVLVDDPRLGPLVQRVDPSARTAREAALRVAEQRVTPTEARQVGKALRELDQEAARLRRLPLRDELSSLVAAIVPAEKGQEMVADRLGLGGQAAMTLQEAGDRSGVTRERVRQVENRFHQAVNECTPWTPVLDRVLRRLTVDAPTPLSERWRELESDGVVGAEVSPRSVGAAATALGKHLDVVIDEAHDLIIPGRFDPEVADRLASCARALVSHWGATTIDELLADVSGQGIEVNASLARLLVQRIHGFSWLDEPTGWFWVRGTGRNRLLNQVEKVMSVAGSITIGELRDGVGRHHRMQGFRPPREVLAQLCEQTGLYRREGDRLIGGPDLPDWKDVLGANERALVEVLFAHGPLMRRDELEQRVVDERGLNRSSFYVYLGYSPVIQRFAPSVYGLRGAEVSAAEVDALIPARARSQVLQDHGWTEDGDVWVAYRISPAAERSGVLSAPGSLKSVVQGGFELFAEDGRTVGTVVVEDNTWGLSPFFRRHGIEAGDYVVLRFALRERTATILAGGSDLLVRFQRTE